MPITITGRDVIACVLLVGAFGLRAMGIDGLAEWLIVGIAGVYLGVSVAPRWKD